MAPNLLVFALVLLPARALRSGARSKGTEARGQGQHSQAALSELASHLLLCCPQTRQYP
jgi:hypothetical protein